MFPQFVAHSQNNPKDLPGLLTSVLALVTFTRLQAISPLRHLLYAGLAYGLALTTHVSAVFLLPVFVIWHLVSGRRLPFRSYVLIAAVAVATAFLCWPWLWSAPVERLVWAWRHIGQRFGYQSFPVLYFGRIYQGWELPWHYTLVSLIMATPFLYLVWILCSTVGMRSRSHEPDGSPWAASVVAWSWCAIMIAAEMRAPMRYDGARHLLVIVPGLCLLAAVGFDRILAWITRAPLIARSGMLHRAAAPACAAVAFAFVGAQVIRIHPYQNAYLNEIANAWIADKAEDLFEVEYWCQSYKEGAEWLNRHAEPDAAIFIGFGDEVAARYLKRRFLYLDEENWPSFQDRTRPAYLMLMTRKTRFSAVLQRAVRRYDSVFAVRRQKGTLLAVYSNRHPAANPN